MKNLLVEENQAVKRNAWTFFNNLVLSFSKLMTKIVGIPKNIQILALTSITFKQSVSLFGNSRKSFLQKFLISFYLTTLVLIGIRSTLMAFVFTNDRNLIVSVLGSIFQMVYIDRFLIEVCIIFLNTYALMILYSIFFNQNRLVVFKLVILYCYQIFDPKHPNAASKNVFVLPDKIFEKTKRGVQHIYLFGGYAHYLFSGEFIFVTTCIYSFGDTSVANLDLYPSKAVFYLNGILMIIMWTSWAFICSIFMINAFVIFLSSTHILTAKIDSIISNLTTLNKTKFSMKQELELARQMALNVELFDEILLMNRFWKVYLTVTNVLFSLWTCFIYYIVLITDAILFMRLFFMFASVVPISILIVSTYISAKIYVRAMLIYKCYAVLLSNKRITISNRRQIKVRNG